MDRGGRRTASGAVKRGAIAIGAAAMEWITQGQYEWRDQRDPRRVLEGHCRRERFKCRDSAVRFQSGQECSDRDARVFEDGRGRQEGGSRATPCQGSASALPGKLLRFPEGVGRGRDHRLPWP